MYIYFPIIHSIIVIILLVVTLYLTISSINPIIGIIKSGKSIAIPKMHKKRILGIFSFVIKHKKILEDRQYGIMHLIYFYGFFILSIGHLEFVLFSLTKFLLFFEKRPFKYRLFLNHWFLKFYEFSQDIMALAVVITVFIALHNRIFKKKLRLTPRSTEAEIILLFIGMLYVSFFLLSGSETFERMQLGEMHLKWNWNLPFSSLVAFLVKNKIHNFAYWSHLLLFFGFIIYIPRSKHLHFLTAMPNIYFRDLNFVAKPISINFEQDEKFGASEFSDFPKKSLLDIFSCTECSRCDSVCPAALTGKPLKPKKILQDIKRNIQTNIKHGTVIPLVNKNSEGSKKEGQLQLDEIWSCTTCAACVEACPVLINSVPVNLMQIRQNLILTEANYFPKEAKSTFKNIETKNNPWGINSNKYVELSNEFEISILEDQEVDYLFWLGCSGSMDDRIKKIQKDLVKVLKASNINFATLGLKEKCTGDPARRMGNEYVYVNLVNENINVLNSKKFKKIFTTCPHCLNQLKNEYKDFGGNYNVQHHTELLNELLSDKRIPIDTKKELKEKVTFHDPCYLGRYNNQYDAPREALVQIGATTIEMPFNKQKSFCCGAGGGRMFMEEKIGKRINVERTDQALSVNAKIIATGCPFCLIMLNDGVKDREVDNMIKVKDIAELIAEQLID